MNYTMMHGYTSIKYVRRGFFGRGGVEGVRMEK